MNVRWRWVLPIAFLFSVAAQGQVNESETSQPSATDSLKIIFQQGVNKIARQLMAPCCWSETADVHNSEAAQEVKAQIRSALQQGYSEKQILDGMVAAYGERVLAKPKATGFNLMAWILPALALVIGSVVAWRFLAHSRMKASPQPVRKIQIDESYNQRLERELEELDS
jgi:cytochrome c-type biogenesis protein CcmH